MGVGNTKSSSSGDWELWLPRRWLLLLGMSEEVAPVLSVASILQKGRFATSMHQALQFAAWCVKPHRFPFVLMSRAVNCDRHVAHSAAGLGDSVLLQHPVPSCRSWRVMRRNGWYLSLSLCETGTAGAGSSLWAAHVILHYLLCSRARLCPRKAFTFNSVSTWGLPNLLYHSSGCLGNLISAGAAVRMNGFGGIISCGRERERKKY